MDKILRFVGGLLLGALVGVGVVLLFTPRSGSEARQAIQERYQEILAAGQKAAEDRRVELTAQFEALKQPRQEE